MSNAHDQLAARITTAQRREAAQFRCHKCPLHFPSEVSWWRHLKDSHPDTLAEFTTEEARADFRASKREECRISKLRSRIEQQQQSENSAEWSQPGQGQVARGSRAARVGITKRLETLRLEKQQSEDNKIKGEDEEDLEMAESPSSPIRSSGQNRQAPQADGGNRRTRTVHGGRGGGRRTKEPFDPEFDRSLPEAGGPKQTRRLFDPSQPLLWSRNEDSIKRPQNAPAAIASNTAQASARARAPRAKKENKTPKGRGEKPAALAISAPEVHSREAGKHFIMRNLGHDTQAQQSVQLVLHPQPQSRMETEDGSISGDDSSLKMVRQPETRPISGDQLLSEVKGIYAGLVMVEAKCVEVDGKQAAQAKAMEVEGLKPPRLTNEQWQALIALHRTLLHEHHDFFLASQHPSSSQALRRLAAKYEMPARMWRHGIHSFLELLRHRLPYSLEHMLTFIYLAYSIMALLYETVPAFEDTWIECLGDLGRYRMAIEDDDIGDREVWTNVARSWYSKAADKKPTVGRLYHHIAILARPNVLQQLFFYCKSLTVGQPFASARESILSLFEPILSSKPTASRSQPVDVKFITLHGIWFTHTDLDRFDGVLDEYMSLLDKHISRVAEKWTVSGCLVAVCNIAALYQYNSRTSKLRQAWKEGTVTIKEEEMENSPALNNGDTTGNEYDSLLPPLPREASSEHGTPFLAITSGKAQCPYNETKALVAAAIKQEAGDEGSWVPLEYAIKMSFSILGLVLERVNDNYVLPHVHTWMVFLYHMTNSTPAMRLIEQDFPFESLASFLNSLIMAEAESLSQVESTIHFEIDEFPKRSGRPLPEDWTLRGLEFTRNYFPSGWIEEAKVDDEERLLELPSFLAARKERILWLGYMIAKGGDWLSYSAKTETFSVHTGVLERIKAYKEAAQIKKEGECMPYIKPEAESDVEMEIPIIAEDDFGDFEDLEQSEDLQQLRALKLKQRELKSKIQSGGTPGEEEMNHESSRRVSAREALRPNFTILVVDTNFMLSSLDIFKLMVVNNDWSVVVPNTVMTELMGLNSSPTVGSAASNAISAIQASIVAKKDLRIITAKGSNVTNMGMGFYREKLEDHYEGADMSIDDVIIAITEAQGKLRVEMMRANGNDAGTAQPAVLVTDDRNMRVKATAKQIPALSGSAVKAILQPQGPKPQASRMKKKPIVATTPLASLRQTFPEATEEDLVNALKEADENLEVAEMNLYTNIATKSPGMQKRRLKKEQGRVAGAG
ncbi:hypothetical protein L211DRAFT_869220 [Terfezia boudieri ATCC MYA-4762]|uniref:Nonsense-mediated mRNA decay factor n=1 Tax=Terfezia boudieri ATCC MYA-4762 TaxID=1051890 RepID=A0A3N4LIN0_9PEZI|nr:hypothetical protein L211DRAFT_869220 [Terfezia boudieri ATCC MYA-4762]